MTRRLAELDASASADAGSEFGSSDRALLATAGQWLDASAAMLASADWPRRLAAERGIDLATAALHEQLRRDGRLILAAGAGNSSPSENSSDNAQGATLAIVPGAFYREHPQTGADGAPLIAAARALGCQATLVPTPSIGTLAEGADALLAWLETQTVDRIVLASLSKGGADVKMALAHPRAARAFARVVGWINVGGITNGSPMVSWLLQRKLPTLIYRFLFWRRGRNFQFIRDLERRPDSPLSFPVAIPPHLRVIHIIGFPLARHVRGKRAEAWHRRLAPLGPNDGAVILADSLAIPGKVFAAWGADHFSPQQLDLPAMLTAACREIFGDGQSSPASRNSLSPAVV